MSSSRNVAIPAFDDREAEVLTKATVRAAERLGLTHAQLASVLGVSASTVSRLANQPLARPKALELATLFVRLYRSLIGVVGTDSAASEWMAGFNHFLDARPMDRIAEVEGLVETLRYLDAMRARV